MPPYRLGCRAGSVSADVLANGTLSVSLSSQASCDEVPEFEHSAADPSLHCSERLA
jgi:hypothetical protein